MAAVLIEIALWICRAARILLMAVCLFSCFYTKEENRFYALICRIAKPFTAVFAYIIKLILKKKEISFALDAFLAYVLMWYVTKLFMYLKLSMGFIQIP